jgi:hypothetical protein
MYQVHVFLFTGVETERKVAEDLRINRWHCNYTFQFVYVNS